jgi:hypothetical protein
VWQLRVFKRLTNSEFARRVQYLHVKLEPATSLHKLTCTRTGSVSPSLIIAGSITGPVKAGSMGMLSTVANGDP